MTINRRDALKMLGAVPLASMLGTETHERSTADATERTEAPAKLAFFTAHEWATVHVLADMIIPRDERSGSATDAQVPEFMDHMMAEAPEMSRTEMHGGLAWLDTQCRSRFAHAFIDCTNAQRREILDDIAWPARAKPELSNGVAFFNTFRDMVASGFFSSQIGYGDVRYIGNVFNPNWNGCPADALAHLGVSYDNHPPVKSS